MIDFFRQSAILTAEELLTLSTHFRSETFKRKAIIHQPPTVFKKTYFVCHGVVRQSFQQDGVEVTAYLYLKNSFFTDLRSFLEGKPCNYTFHAVSDCHLQSISYQNLEKLYANGASFERWGRKIFETISLEVISSAETLLFLSPEERFAKLLKESPQVLQLLPSRHIAAILGVAPKSFSRIKKRMYKKLKS